MADPAQGDEVELELREALSPELLLVEKLAEGGMGQVFRARDPALKRDVAVKVLLSDLAKNPEGKKRFLREEEAIAALSHPNVVPIYRVGELPSGLPYYVTRFVHGRDLALRVADEGPLSVTEACQILGQAASALAAAHERGIVHRDIKAANILYDDQAGHALVMDFGISSLMAPADETTAPDRTKLTQARAVLGTPRSMSPEQSLGDQVTEATDVYSLGAVAYELLLGRGPFETDSPQRLVVAHVSETPQPLVALRADVDPELSAIVERCLAKDPAERPRAEEVARKLDPSAGTTLEWPPPGLEELQGAALKPHRWLFAGSAILLALPATWYWIRLPTAAENLVVVGFLASYIVATVAAGLLVWGLQLLFRAGWLSMDASRLGYGWLTIAHVLTDPHGDVGRLLSGSREYASLKEAERSRVLVRRILEAGVNLLVGVLPLPLAALALVTLREESRSLGGGALMVALPIGVLLVAGVVLQLSNALTLQDTKRARSHWTRPSSAVVSLVPGWLTVLRRMRAPSTGPSGGGWLGPVVAGGACFAALAAALVVGTFGFVASFVYIFLVDREPPRVELSFGPSVQASRWLGLEPDSSIDLVEARQLYETLFDPLAGSGTDWVVPAVADSTLWSSPLLGGRPDHQLSLFEIIPRAIEGLTPAELALLDRLADHPHVADFSRLARAPAFSPVAGLDIGPDFFWTDLEPPGGARFQASIIRKTAQAGALVARGRIMEAETVLREIVSVGLLVFDGGVTSRQAWWGAFWGWYGLRLLEPLYASAGNADASARIRAAADLSSADAESSRPILENRSQSMAVARNANEVRGRRWDFVHLLSMTFHCQGIAAILTGPTDEERAFLEDVRATLVRSPAEDALFDAAAEHALRVGRLGLQGDAGLDGWPLSGLAGTIIRWTSRVARAPALLGCPATFGLIG